MVRTHVHARTGRCWTYIYPVIVGNDGDEGSAFSFPTLNLTYVHQSDPLKALNTCSHEPSTDDEFLSYVNSNFFNTTPRAAVAKILTLYPSDPAAGSPFGTGDEFAYSPQYKRMSAFQGDYIEQAPRRVFVQKLAESQPVYSYCASSPLPVTLSSHPTDLYSDFNLGRLVSWINQVDGIGAVRMIPPDGFDRPS